MEAGLREAARPSGEEKSMPSITVTPIAVKKIRESFQKMGVEGGLRLGVLGGGCSGLSYQFKFEPKPRPSDLVYNSKTFRSTWIRRASCSWMA
jgi:iron-sulfur cluster assembly protein